MIDPEEYIQSWEDFITNHPNPEELLTHTYTRVEGKWVGVLRPSKDKMIQELSSKIQDLRLTVEEAVSDDTRILINKKQFHDLVSLNLDLMIYLGRELEPKK
jgi:hypothetical protein